MLNTSGSLSLKFQVGHATPFLQSKSGYSPSHVVSVRIQRLLVNKPFTLTCVSVPLDLWFTTRIDRTWQVQDLKVWLLSKALPDSALALPPSYRPSSPVTFAAPPPPMPATHSSPPHSPHAGNGSPRDGPGLSSPPSPYDYLFDTDDVSLYAPSYYTVDSVDEGRVRPMTPSRSVAYSFSTGAPSISGLEALKANNMRTLNRTFPGASDGKDTELWKRATELAAKWCIYSFSTVSTTHVLANDSDFSLSPRRECNSLKKWPSQNIASGPSNSSNCTTWVATFNFPGPSVRLRGPCHHPFSHLPVQPAAPTAELVSNSHRPSRHETSSQTRRIPKKTTLLPHELSLARPTLNLTLNVGPGFYATLPIRKSCRGKRRSAGWQEVAEI